MTLENADGFIAWDVASYLGVALLTMLLIVTIGNILSKNKGDSVGSYLYYLLFLKYKKNEEYDSRGFLTVQSIEFYPVLLLVFCLRGFLYEPFVIPSNSMMPTLLTGDYILVNKYSYGVKIPILNKQVFEISKPMRGDVVVFRYPNYEKDPMYSGADFIKRVIGLPGDKIEYKKDILLVNGGVISVVDSQTYKGIESGKRMTGEIESIEKLEEVGGQNHTILNSEKHYSISADVKVPEGHYFVMGDNRSHSSDSRVWGFVPEEYIIGKPSTIWMHKDETFKFDRIGSFK